MNTDKINRLARINEKRASLNLRKLIDTKDVKLFNIMETARCKWWAKKMRVFYS